MKKIHFIGKQRKIKSKKSDVFFYYDPEVHAVDFVSRYTSKDVNTYSDYRNIKKDVLMSVSKRGIEYFTVNMDKLRSK